MNLIRNRSSYENSIPTLKKSVKFMETAGFFLVIATGIIVIFISIALDFLWAHAIPVRFFYYFLRAPGVVVHECAHILGCLLTGAKIRHVVLFSKEGGSVTYNPPVIPVIGNVVISTAPLLCIPLVLVAVTWVFSTYLGCSFSQYPQTLETADAVIALVIGDSWDIFPQPCAAVQWMVPALPVPDGQSHPFCCTEYTGY